MQTKTNRKKEFLVIFGIFVISVIFHYIIADYPKMFHVYFDELIYYDEAESIASGRGILVHNTQMGLARILYPLLISPAFLISNRIWQQRIALLINTLVMSSSVFPAYLISKRMLKVRERYVVAVLAVIMSDLCYTMTFMSEVLFLPITLWLIYFFTKEGNREKADLKKVFICGVLSALVYYTKEVGLMFIPAFFIVYLYDVIKAGNENKKRILIRSITEYMIIAVVFLILIFPHFLDLLRRVLGLLNTPVVTQSTLVVASEGGKQINVFYAAMMQLIYYLLAAGIMPMIFPVIMWKKLSEEKKRMCILLFSLMMFMAILVAYTITVHEDLHFPFPRAHLRYVCYLWLPFLILFYSLYDENNNNKIRWIFAAVFVFIAAMIFKGAYEGTTIDQTMLYYENKVFNDHIWIYRIALCMGTASFILMYIKNRKLAVRLFTIVFGLILLSNNIIAFLIHRKDYIVDNEKWEQMVLLEQYVKDNSDAKFLVIDNTYDDPQRLMDTFLNRENVFFVNPQDIIYLENANVLPVCKLVPNSRFFPGGKFASELTRADYAIIRKDKGVYVEGGAEMIMENVGGTGQYDLYKLSDNKMMPYIHN